MGLISIFGWAGRHGRYTHSEPATEPAVFPCFSAESGYIARHLTRKHGSQRPSGGNRAI